MKKQENLATEILRTALKKQKFLSMAFLTSLIVNVLLSVKIFIKKWCEIRWSRETVIQNEGSGFFLERIKGIWILQTPFDTVYVTVIPYA